MTIELLLFIMKSPLPHKQTGVNKKNILLMMIIRLPGSILSALCAIHIFVVIYMNMIVQFITFTTCSLLNKERIRIMHH